MERIVILLFVLTLSFNLNAQEKCGVFLVPENSVTFFRLSSSEFDSIAKLTNSEGLYEVASDFGYYALEIIELYKDSLITVGISNSRRFKIHNDVIDKFDLESPYGIIFYSVGRYKIASGVHTDVGIKQLISEFFRKE